MAYMLPSLPTATVLQKLPHRAPKDPCEGLCERYPGTILVLIAKMKVAVAQQKFADISKQSAENFLTLINEILDFSKLEANKTEIDSIEIYYLPESCKVLNAPIEKTTQYNLISGSEIKTNA